VVGDGRKKEQKKRQLEPMNGVLNTKATEKGGVKTGVSEKKKGKGCE